MVQVWAEEMCRNNDWLTSLGGDPQEHQHQPVGIEFPNLPGSNCVHKFHDGPTYGYSYTWQLFERLVKERPIPILYETPARELIQHDVTKEILGVRAQRGGKSIDVKARRGMPGADQSGVAKRLGTAKVSSSTSLSRNLRLPAPIARRSR